LVVIGDIQLPNNTHYHFDYDSNGLVKKITYPSGAWVSYVWGSNDQSEVGYECSNATTGDIEIGSLPGGCSAKRISWPAVKERTVSFDGQHPALRQEFTYSTGGWVTEVHENFSQ